VSIKIQYAVCRGYQVKPLAIFTSIKTVELTTCEVFLILRPWKDCHYLTTFLRFLLPLFFVVSCNGKGKAVPLTLILLTWRIWWDPNNASRWQMAFNSAFKGLQAWSGPEGFRKLKFPDFMTTAQDGGKVVSHTHRPTLPPANAPGTHFC